jgi:perosamine synthetase
MRRLKEFAEEHRIYVLEDAAHAFPAKYENAYVGTQSSATAYSFYATKTLTTGEGGMVVTNSDELLARMQTMRLHGMSKDAWKRYTAGGSWFYEIVAPGFKYNLTDLQSAIGLVQLAKAERMRVQRQNIAECYSCALKCVAELILPTPNPLAVSAWHLYVVLVNLDMLRISRDEVMLQLQARGISCAVHFIPLHYHPYYQQSWGYALGDFPAAEAYFKRCISLPLYPEMTQQEVDYVVTNLIDIVKANRR